MKLQGRVQTMQQQLSQGNYCVTLQGHQYEMVFDPIEASTPPRIATPPVTVPPTPPPAQQTNMCPTWEIQLEREIAKIERQEREQQQQQQQATQAVQQQEVILDISEIENIKPLSVPLRDN